MTSDERWAALKAWIENALEYWDEEFDGDRKGVEKVADKMQELEAA